MNTIDFNKTHTQEQAAVFRLFVLNWRVQIWRIMRVLSPVTILVQPVSSLTTFD